MNICLRDCGEIQRPLPSPPLLPAQPGAETRGELTSHKGAHETLPFLPPFSLPLGSQ